MFTQQARGSLAERLTAICVGTCAMKIDLFQSFMMKEDNIYRLVDASMEGFPQVEIVLNYLNSLKPPSVISSCNPSWAVSIFAITINGKSITRPTFNHSKVLLLALHSLPNTSAVLKIDSNGDLRKSVFCFHVHRRPLSLISWWSLKPIFKWVFCGGRAKFNLQSRSSTWWISSRGWMWAT